MAKSVLGNTDKVGSLKAWLQEHEDEMAALLSELIAIPTENPPGRNYGACVDLLEKRLLAAGLEYKRIEAPSPNKQSTEPLASLFAGYGSGDRTLYFHGHYDVVPAQSQEQFQPVRKEHFLFGRGSCDMKGGIVAMLFAIRAIKELGAELPGRIGLTLVPNEETGGEGGSSWLTQEGKLGRGGIGMLLAEPTSGVVWNANRGAITLRVNVFGKSVHVGLQHQGQNAFERMVQVVERLQSLKREVEQRATQYEIGADQARNSILLLGGQSGGGTNFNVVPDQCWFTVDRRINPEEEMTVERTRLFGVLEGCQRNGIPLEWEILQEGNSAACRKENPLGEALAQSIKTVTGETAQFEMCPGLLEIRFYAAKGIPAYAYGPGLLSVAHGPNEYVDLRKVIDVAAVYALTGLSAHLWR
jgi:succinyl-diaminopimelate desuccinylase